MNHVVRRVDVDGVGTGIGGNKRACTWIHIGTGQAQVTQTNALSCKYSLNISSRAFTVNARLSGIENIKYILMGSIHPVTKRLLFYFSDDRCILYNDGPDTHDAVLYAHCSRARYIVSHRRWRPVRDDISYIR